MAGPPICQIVSDTDIDAIELALFQVYPIEKPQNADNQKPDRNPQKNVDEREPQPPKLIYKRPETYQADADSCNRYCIKTIR